MARPSEEIKDRLDIVEFIKGYLNLTPAGKNFKALCPFHQEKTPSFMVSPERQTWHCFGCGEGGDVFTFLMKYENLEFYEALQVLAERAGVELKRLSPAEERQFGILYDLNAAAAEFFEEALGKSERAKEYLAKRGLTDETLQDFAVGFAPNTKDELTVYLINRGFAVGDIIRAGLTIKTERGQHIDRFRGRIMFPIHSHIGKVVGFSGRILPELETEHTGKYVNSPDSPIFNKSRILYGFWESKRAIAEEGEALLVEGQMDFLLAWQDGVKNVVATSGTALTGDHLRALRRITNKLVLAFDADDAGRRAAERSIDLAGAHDFSVYILSLGGFGDPAEAAVEKPGYLRDAMAKAKTAMEFYFEEYLKENAMGKMEDRKLAIRALLAKIKHLWSPIERAHWIRELSHRVGVSERDLVEEMDRLGIGEREESDPELERAKRTLERHELIAERILSLVALHKRLEKELESHMAYLPTRYQDAFRVIVDGAEATPDIENMANLASLQAGFLFENLTEEKVEAEMRTLLYELTLEYLRKERAEAARRIQLAEEKGDEEALTERLKEFDDILRKMQDVEHAREEVRES